MHVLFVAPEFPAYQRQFVRALKEVGAAVTGIGERPIEALGEMSQWLDGYERVGSVVHEPSLIDAVRRIQARGWVHRLECTIEAHVLATARAREATGIPGTSLETAILCRDKPEMKEYLRQRGISCAQSTAAETPAQVREFVAAVGYPIILKPRAAAGASGTWRVDSEAELDAVLHECGVHRGVSVAVEEFIEGHEGFYDTLVVHGEVVLEFISHYYPSVLPAMRNRWISPQIVVTNRVDAPSYDELKAMGRKVIRELGLGTTATHMEWFFGPKGLKFSEIAARPPGVGQWDLYSAANDFDIYRQWAAGIVHGKLDQRPSRRYSAGIVALRPDRDGRIQGYEGLDRVRRQYENWLIDYHLPPAGAGTQPIEGGYMANAWIRLKHPDYDVLRRMLDDVGETVKLHAA
jgi:carbamoylphosphate synthase large subunit